MADVVGIYYGGYSFDGNTILMDDGSGVIQSGYFDFSEGGHLYLEGVEGNFFYVGESSLSAHLDKMGKTPYFEELGIVTDFMPDEGRYTLDNGGVYYYEDGSGYTTVPVEYDGLVYCAESFPGTFEAMNAMIDESKSITELQELNDYFYFDPYTGLFCRIY